MNPAVYEFVANCAAGLENLTSSEISSFGGNTIESVPGMVRWQGGLETAYRACLWSRYASKILLLLKSFPLKDEESFPGQSLDTLWTNHLNSEMTFSVSATLADNPVITHSHYAALRVKDGIADHFRQSGLQRPQCGKRASTVSSSPPYFRR